MEKVLITGGSSGIGAGFAKAFHDRGAKVIIAGRDLDKLKQYASSFQGMECVELDVSHPESVARAVEWVKARHPDLNVLINNAGIQRVIRFDGDEPIDELSLSEEIETNLKGLIRVTHGFLPILKQQSQAKLIHIGSALAFVPLIQAPIYSATKAAVHSFTISLREQLRSTRVQVIEVLPPAVKTSLHREQKRKPPKVMELEEFIARTMKALDSGRQELPIGLAAVLKWGARIAPNRFLKLINREAE